MKKIKIGLVGLGVVGKSVYEILSKQKAVFQDKIGAELEIVAACARSQKDFLDKSAKFTTNPLEIAQNKEIDLIVEVAGNAPNIEELWVEALKNGKSIITANKALLAQKGLEMAVLAEKNSCQIAYEAACAGAIPVVKLFKEGLVANEIQAFCGILNGTSNYILTKMKEENIDFATALKQAQDAGYAEADPTFDVEGIDAAHKLALLSAIAAKAKPAFDELYIEGITKITIDDINFADELGYKIKLLGIYKNQGESCIQALYPALVDKNSRIASVDDSFNAIFSQNSNAGDSFIVGRGAGGFQTASAVVADIIDFASTRNSAVFGVVTSKLKTPKIKKIQDRKGQYFLKIELERDKKSEILSEEFLTKIGVQKSYFDDSGDNISCALITTELLESDFVAIFEKIDCVKKSFLRVENF